MGVSVDGSRSRTSGLRVEALKVLELRVLGSGVASASYPRIFRVGWALKLPESEALRTVFP